MENCDNLKRLSIVLDKNKAKPKALRDELMAFLLADLKNSYDFGIKTLRLISTISPMVGLLGTVIGIIKVFKTISLETGPVTPALISDGLWNAMMTTAIGLSIALPSLMAAFIFSRISEARIEAYQTKLNKRSFVIEDVSI
ncbi:MAG: MotA/TolQ/ExbB proton channel family protein [Rickettsiales bacterium]|nr:MotA/TolQ/ExbB proton channel family protein [Rickettsiales bacterium]